MQGHSPWAKGGVFPLVLPCLSLVCLSGCARSGEPVHRSPLRALELNPFLSGRLGLRRAGFRLACVCLKIDLLEPEPHSARSCAKAGGA